MSVTDDTFAAIKYFIVDQLAIAVMLIYTKLYVEYL